MRLRAIDNLPNELKANIRLENIAGGHRLFRQGDRADYLYLVEQGRFQEFSYPEGERMAVLQILSPGDTLGETSLLYENYRSTVIAQIDSQVIAYPKSILLEASKQYPWIVEAIIEILCQKIYELQMRLEWRNISVADRRVLEYLKYNLTKLSEEAEETNTLTLNAPLQEIAAELGFVPGTLSRALSKLEAEQIITRQSNLITLHDSDAA